MGVCTCILPRGRRRTTMRTVLVAAMNCFLPDPLYHVKGLRSHLNHSSQSSLQAFALHIDSKKGTPTNSDSSRHPECRCCQPHPRPLLPPRSPAAPLVSPASCRERTLISTSRKLELTIMFVNGCRDSLRRFSSLFHSVVEVERKYLGKRGLRQRPGKGLWNAHRGEGHDVERVTDGWELLIACIPQEASSRCTSSLISFMIGMTHNRCWYCHKRVEG